MNIKSLMVGDWVYNKHHGKNIRLTPYDFFTHTHNEFGEQELSPFSKPTIGIDLEPIPLTADILEKNGFYYDEDRKFYLMGVIFQIKPENGGRFSFKICGCPYPLNTVHELQHVMRICGVEKEIEL